MKDASMSLGIYFEIKDAELYGGEGTTGYAATIVEKLNRTALATRGKYERLQNPEYNKRYNRGQNEDYEYQGIRSISGKDILKDRELMDGAEFQELEPVASK